MSRSLIAVAVCLLLLLAAILRCDHISSRSIWFDEAFSWILASRSTPSEIVSRTSADVHPPLYYLVLWCWVKAFGASLISLRLPSVLFGIATVAGCYLVGRDAIKELGVNPTNRARAYATGLISMALVATSASQVRWAWEARMYTQATFLLIIGTWCIVRALDASPERAQWWWAGFTASSTAMLYTHNYALFSFVGQCVFILMEFIRRGGWWRLPFRVQGFWSSMMAMGCVAWAYLPWLPILQAQKAQVQTDYWIPKANLLSIPRALYALMLPSNSEPAVSDRMAIISGVVVLILIAALCLERSRLSRLALALFVTPMAFAYVISLVSVSIIVDRHFLLAQLFALIGAAGLIGRLAPSPTWWLFAFVLVFDSLFILQGFRTDLNIPERPGVRGAVEYVLAHRNPDEPILVLHPCIFFNVLYYVGGSADPKLYSRPENVTHYTGKPILIPTDYFPQGGLDSLAANRVWVINTNGFVGHSPMLIPSTWKAGQSKRFQEVYFFQGNVTVIPYNRIAVSNASPRIKQ